MDITDDDIKKDDETQCITIKRLINLYIGECKNNHINIRNKIINILMKSCASGYIKTVREIMDNDDIIDIDVNTPDAEHRYSALYTACLFNNSEIVDYLIQSNRENIDLNIKNKYNETPIIASYYYDNIECILLLCANGARLPIGYDDNLSTFSKRVLEYVDESGIFSDEYIKTCEECVNGYILSDLTNIVIGYICPKDLVGVKNLLLFMMN